MSGAPDGHLALEESLRVNTRVASIDYDVLMNPTVTMPPPEHGYIGPEVPFDTSLERLKWFIPFTPVQNVSGGPAISLPLGRSSEGLPIGVQFAASLGRERTLLELGLELEAAAPWPQLAE